MNIKLSEDKYKEKLTLEEISLLRSALKAADFEIGEHIRDDLIPQAIFYYTGEIDAEN